LRFSSIIRKSLSLLLIIATLHCAGGKNRTPDSAYARILILNYANRTESPDFDYLSESLGEATRGAMKSRFEYREIVKNDATLLLQNDEQITEKTGGDADVLILGSYQKAIPTAGRKKAETIVVSGKIFSLRHKKLIAEYSKTAVVDARIFTTVNEIAQQAVLSIQAYVKKINNDETAAATTTGKEALTLERLKLKVFVPPMF
jgi:hypothetical protein